MAVFFAILWCSREGVTHMTASLALNGANCQWNAVMCIALQCKQRCILPFLIPLDFYYAIEIKEHIDNGQSAEYASQLVQGKVPCVQLSKLSAICCTAVWSALQHHDESIIKKYKVHDTECKNFKSLRKIIYAPDVSTLHQSVQVKKPSFCDYTVGSRLKERHEWW